MLKKLAIGVCYYPEHWDKSMWENDLDRMKEHGIECVRIAEFAWSKTERVEGEFNFDFFDEFVALCAAKGMKVIFCTPTATPPAWLTHNYPEALNCDIDGTQYKHGSRRHVTLNSPKYRELTEKIVTALAEHYGDNPTIVGWQIDNEINCEKDVYYAEADHAAFRTYLQEKFGTLDNLNQKMGNVFWNQEYTDWAQIRLPGKTNQNEFNPHMTLEEKRFISHTACSYIRLQARIIRKYAKNQFITTNGLFDNLDYHALIGDGLDYITYDNYPNFAFDYDGGYDPEGWNDRNCTYNLTLSRSISNTFGIMEQQSGAGGWHTRMLQPMPEPGQLKLWTLSAVALGADYISYFRWRTSTIGSEIYWHGLNDYCNEDNRRLRELKETHAAFLKIAGVYAKDYRAQVALLMDYDNRWGSFDRWNGDLQRRSMDVWQRALEYAHITYDFVNITDATDPAELAKYDLVVYPHPSILTAPRVEMLKAVTANGGRVLFGARAGYKDIDGHAVQQAMPGLLRELCGATVEEYTLVSPKYRGMTATLNGKTIDAPYFSDVLRPETAKTVATFNDTYYAGKPAMTANAYGDGTAYYFGAGFSVENAADLIEYFGLQPLCAELVTCSKNIQFASREDAKEAYWFFANYKDCEEKFVVNGTVADLISGESFSGECTLAPYQVVVVKAKK